MDRAGLIGLLETDQSPLVRAAAASARTLPAPEASQVIRLVNFGFTVDAPLKAGHHTIRVLNEGPDPHDLVMVKLEPGKTLDDLRSWLQGPDGPPPSKAKP